MDNTDIRPVYSDILFKCIILTKNNINHCFFTDLIINLIPLRGAFVLLLNIIQGSGCGISSAPGLNIKSSLVIIQKNVFQEVRPFCRLFHISYIFDISNLCDTLQISWFRISVRVLAEIWIYLFISVQNVINPLCSCPAVRFHHCAILHGAAGIMICRACHDDACNVHLIGVQHQPHKGILVVHFTVCSDHGPYLSGISSLICHRHIHFGRYAAAILSSDSDDRFSALFGCDNTLIVDLCHLGV